MRNNVAPILVLGIGNPLMGDEGVGVRVVELLMSAFQFPDTVELLDAGTMGLGMLHLLRDRNFVLVVDAVDRTGHPAGTIVRLSPEDIAPNQVMHSLHDMKFVNVLEAAELTGVVVHAECIGVQVGRIEQWVTTLTPEVENALQAAIEAVLIVLAEKGVTSKPCKTDDGTARIIESIRTYEDAD